jgi:hypothetical protein
MRHRDATSVASCGLVPAGVQRTTPVSVIGQGSHVAAIRPHRIAFPIAPAPRGSRAMIDASLGRFLYYVRPAAQSSAWEMQFGFDGNRFTYSCEKDAVDAAREAARLHWECQHEPSGVYVVSPRLGRRLLDIFGTRR